MHNVAPGSLNDVIHRAKHPAPELSKANVEVSIDNVNVETVIAVTGEVMTRLYSGLFLTNQLFRDKLRSGHPEAPKLMEQSIRINLLEPLISNYPDFEQFDFIVSNTGSIIGQNPFTNTVLSFMNALMLTPIATTQEINPAMRPTASIGNDVWAPSQLVGDRFFDPEDELED